MKNNADAIIVSQAVIQLDICAENVTNIPCPTREIARANCFNSFFSCGSSNVNVLGKKE